MQISSLSQVAQQAIGAMDHSIASVERVAGEVAAGLSTTSAGSTADFSGALSRLPALKQQAAANAVLMRTIDELFNELALLPRK